MKPENINEHPKVGSLWTTAKNQDRLVLKIVGTDVCYAARGGNKLNEFETRYRCSIQKFLKECELESEAISSERFDKIKELHTCWLEKQA